MGGDKRMDIIKRSPDKYGLYKVGKKCHRIVKILREYENDKEAIDDLTKLMVGEITEEELVEGREDK